MSSSFSPSDAWGRDSLEVVVVRQHVADEGRRLTELVRSRVQERWGGDLLTSMVVGSHAYGLSTPESDVDLRTIHWVTPVPHLIGLSPLTPKQATIQLFGETVDAEGIEEEADVVSQELGKFVSLALKGNPNMVEYLFLPEDCILETSALFQELRAQRGRIISKRTLTTSYFGYATAQLVRMASKVLRNADLKGFPKGKSSFSEKIAFLGENLSRLGADVEYDLKNACHVERLILASIHALRTGELMVHMDIHIPYLMSIRRGEVPFGTLVGNMSQNIGELNEAEKEESPLPDEPDKELLNTILCDFRLSCI